MHLDTSALVDALTGTRRSFAALEQTIARGHVIAISSLVGGFKDIPGLELSSL